MDIHEMATELWVLAQLHGEEGIEDGTDRIEQFLQEKFLGAAPAFKPQKHQVIDALNQVIGEKLTSYDVSDDHTCVVLLFEDAQVPAVVNMYSSKEILAE